MNTTPDGAATTWRELTDQLSPEQIAYLEDWESRPNEPPRLDGSPRPPEQHRQTLLRMAREFATQNTAATYFADVPLPPEDGHHYPWEHYGDGNWCRLFVGTRRQAGDAEVSIRGTQSSAGAISRSITIDKSDDIDPAQARALAAALLAAADEIDCLTRTETPK